MSQIRKICQYFVIRHAGRKIVEDIVYGHTHTADARLASAFTGFDGDDVFVIHNENYTSLLTIQTKIFLHRLMAMLPQTKRSRSRPCC